MFLLFLFGFSGAFADDGFEWGLDDGFDDTDSEPHEIDWDAVAVRDVVILGSGPGGSTAALYLARAGYRPLVLHGDVPGGQLMKTTEIENFPGFTGTGPELVERIQRQAEGAGAEYRIDRITNVSFDEYPFRLESEENGYKARAVIIATGASARYLGLDSEARLVNRGVSACAVCDGALYTGRDVAVVGGGDTAIEEALYLSRICRSVKLIHRRNELRASKPMKDKLEKSTVEVIWDSVVDEVLGRDSVSGVRLKNVKTGEKTELPISCLFVAIGHTPATDVFRGKIEMDRDGYIVPKPGQATSVPGVFVAGDCADRVFRQAITSAGTGCQAALSAERFLAEREL